MTPDECFWLVVVTSALGTGFPFETFLRLVGGAR